MNCPDIQILIHRDADGVLDAPGADRLRGHLAACRPCAAEHAALRAMRGAFRDLRHADVPAGLAESIAARAAAPREPMLRFPRHFLVPAAAGIVALCLISGAIGFRVREPSTIQAAPDLDRKDEVSYRSFLAGTLELPAERVDAILAVRKDTSDKLRGIDAEAREKRERLLRSEIEAIWKLLPDATRKAHPELDPTRSTQDSPPR